MNVPGEQWYKKLRGRLKTKERKASALSYGTLCGMMLQGSKVQRGKRQEKCHRRKIFHRLLK